MKKTVLYFTGLLLAGFGVAMGSIPGLGTSPISSLPYVTTFFWPWSFGVATVVVNLLMLAAQIAILKKRFRLFQLLQLPMLVIFGIFIDLGMWLFSMCVPENYFFRFLETVLGCFVLAVGIFMQLKAGIVLLPGDNLIRVIADEYRFQFSSVKICFDISISLMALVCSLCVLGNVTGVREGTLVSAFLVGYFIRLISRYSSPFSAKL